MIKYILSIIIPIHPPDFHYIYKLQNKIDIINKCCEIVLVFSNENDYNKFLYKDKFRSIILPPNIKTDNIITFKKFYALNVLKKDYLYFIVCDSEIDIINKNFTFQNIIMKINEFYNNKRIFEGTADSLKKITRTSCEIFKSDDDKIKLKNLTNNFKSYYWWSDIPVYKSSHLEDFFSKIDLNINLNWFHFDHKIYMNYLVLYHDFKFISLTSLIGRMHSLESYFTDDVNFLKILKKNNYTFSWIIPLLFKKHYHYLIENGSFLLYHLDRAKSIIKR